MTLLNFLNVVLTTKWTTLLFVTCCIDGGSEWEVHSIPELFGVLSNITKDDTFIITLLSND